MKIALRSLFFAAVLTIGLGNFNFSGGGPVPTTLPPSPGQTV